MKTFIPALEALPSRESFSHRDRGGDERRRRRDGAYPRDHSRKEKQMEKWEAFARAYSSELPDRVASEVEATNRVDARTGKSAAEEPTT